MTVSVVNANNFKSTPESRKYLLGLLNQIEKDKYLKFVKSVNG